MENSVGSTIEKIKLQEQDIQNKLKEERKHEAALAALHRAIREALLQCAKSDQEILELSDKIQKLRPLLELEKLKHKAIQIQLETYAKMLEVLKAESNQGITKVWNQRSKLCETVQNASDRCDIWALLMRPVCMDSFQKPQLQVAKNDEKSLKLINNEIRLKAALQKRKDIETQREILAVEPDNGEEFNRQVN